VIRLSPILDTGRVKIGSQDPEAYRQRLEAKLRPERIRATLGFTPKFPDLESLVGLRPGRMVRQATRLLSTTDLTSEFIDHLIRRRSLSASLPVDRAQRVPSVSRTLSA
jgi:hypothetical protein